MAHCLYFLVQSCAGTVIVQPSDAYLGEFEIPTLLVPASSTLSCQAGALGGGVGIWEACLVKLRREFRSALE